jgi:hypothetical protein
MSATDGLDPPLALEAGTNRRLMLGLQKFRMRDPPSPDRRDP